LQTLDDTSLIIGRNASRIESIVGVIGAQNVLQKILSGTAWRAGRLSESGVGHESGNGGERDYDCGYRFQSQGSDKLVASKFFSHRRQFGKICFVYFFHYFKFNILLIRIIAQKSERLTNGIENVGGGMRGRSGGKSEKDKQRY